MLATLDLPITLRRLTPEVVNWLLIRSARTGKSTDEVAKEIISKAAKKAKDAPRPHRTGEAA